MPALVLLLAGCGSLPPRDQATHTIAVEGTHDTSIGRTVAASVPAGENGFDLLFEPNKAFDTRIALIRNAERSVDIQVFSWSADGSGARLILALRDAGQRGVRVRLLLDDLHSSEVEPWLEALDGAGPVEVRLFNPFANSRHSAFLKIVTSIGDFRTLRHRMHNKLFVADNQVSIIGGRNVGDRYFSNEGPGTFFDFDILIAGPLVGEMSASFDDYWNSDFSYPLRLLRTKENNKVPVAKAVIWHSLAGASLPGGLSSHVDAGRLSLRTCASARLFADPVEKAAGVSLADSSGTLHQRLISLFATSQSEIYIVSPYFVRGKAGLQRIQDQVARGIRLKLLTNSLKSTDVPVAHVVYLRYRRQILQLGAEIREFAPKSADVPSSNGSAPSRNASHLHAKLAIVDARWLYVGSLNFTGRSERINTELGIVLDCPEIALEVRKLLDQAPAFDLRLNETPLGVEWVDTRRGDSQVWRVEPEVNLWQRFKAALVDPFVPEEEI